MILSEFNTIGEMSPFARMDKFNGLAENFCPEEITWTYYFNGLRPDFDVFPVREAPFEYVLERVHIRYSGPPPG